MYSGARARGSGSLRSWPGGSCAPRPPARVALLQIIVRNVQGSFCAAHRAGGANWKLRRVSRMVCQKRSISSLFRPLLLLHVAQLESAADLRALRARRALRRTITNGLFEIIHPRDSDADAVPRSDSHPLADWLLDDVWPGGCSRHGDCLHPSVHRPAHSRLGHLFAFADRPLFFHFLGQLLPPLAPLSSI